MTSQPTLPGLGHEAAQRLFDRLAAARLANGGNLTKEQWLSEAEAELGAILTLPKRQKAAGPSFSMGVGLSDDQWLSELGAHPALSGINVRAELESCRLWTSVRPGLKVSRKRIVNWMLKAIQDRPIGSADRGRYAAQVVVNHGAHGGAEPEPMGWREEFPDFIGIAEPWEKISADSRAHIVREMAKLAQKQA